MKLLVKLYLAFLKIGTFSFGGGYAMLPFIQKEIVEKNNWISSTEFTDIIGISQMTPGPVAINSATFVGYKISGVIGSIVATLGVITTSFILVVIIGGMCTYFVVNNALIPIVELNKNIKKINEDNLTSNLSVKGPNDEIKELTISFNKMIAKLENAFTSQKRFNSSVAHELKTPLAVIKTNIDVLKRSNCKSIEEYDKTLAIVEKSILKMNLIIETMLDIIKQENAPLNESVSISEILEDIVDDLDIIADKKNIQLKLNTNNIKSKIKGNEIMLYRAFYNVIENAIKYNKINGTVNILCSEDYNIIKVKIIDTGKGIKEEEYEEIFKPFYRCEGINTYSDNGVGLGLSLTQSVIKLHGGEIKVKSKLNEGTEFNLILPYIS